ncbi:MAG TPA: tRNA (adenosine(37)-N6)-dimethylallyltransferase MiaA [Candidatus Angelobacter sp.]|nr:tRNA (adenosine(37)-N6)-dimethylallyltransferase MiaA [Candidatus Angelobacter sp.]
MTTNSSRVSRAARRPLDAILIGGPTAVGKSAVAVALAERIDGEIVSVDSMQVYRGLDLGTAKPSPSDRRRVPHHLIDVVEVNEPFDAAQFVRLARSAVAQIRQRGRVPILCGGTGLYFKAFLGGLGETPAADAALRAKLEATSLAELLHELEQKDPDTFARIDRKNPRRVIRALEVIRLTGKPFSQLRAVWNSLEGTRSTTFENFRDNVEVVPPRFFGLARSSEDLRARIDARVEAMFARGLVEEAKRLLKQGLEENKTAMQAIGYRQVVEHLRGGRSLDETIELVKVRTRQFAKRQMTWFRRQFDLDWVHLKPDVDAEQTAAELFESRGTAQKLAGPESKGGPWLNRN